MQTLTGMSQLLNMPARVVFVAAFTADVQHIHDHSKMSCLACQYCATTIFLLQGT